MASSEFSDRFGRSDVFSMCLHKLTSLNEENEAFLVDLEKLKRMIDDRSAQEEEISALRNQNRKLQDVLGEFQQGLHQEREQVLRLTSENTRLRVREAADQQKLEAIIMKNPGSERLQHVQNARPRLLVSRSTKLRGASKVSSGAATTSSASWADDSGFDGERIRLLQQEMEAQARLHRETVAAMEADRKMIIMERDADNLKNGDEIARLSQRLKDLETLFHEVMKDKLNRRRKDCSEIENILKESAARVLRERQLPQNPPQPEEDPALKKRVKLLEKAAVEKEKEADKLRRQCFASEMMLNDAKEQVESVKCFYQDKLQKCGEKLNLLKKQYEKLDARRKLEASGFRSEIRIVQDQLKKTEQLMLRVVSSQSVGAVRGSPSSSVSTRKSRERSKSIISSHSSHSLKADLKKMRASISKLEHFLTET